ncbi:hypothetical protein RJ641_033575 [Dillenia turbinata]|uniref:Uncharacterized protein n=1 Tax=Dillenia turbinata TaxID=194707 RepID=A0AAN8VM36_9MAGN
MEIELEPRVKPLSYKIKGMSRESPSQKATHVLDTDLRAHWSTATNTKEWILLELDEPCLLSHIRIYNKSVLEWEIAVGLRYKPETFVKVRPRCEAPRRDMMYPMNYTPCRFVRISCLRGNPIAIFFIQLIGVTISGLEAEFQPVVNHLLPNIILHKQDAHDMHLQLLQDLTNRLAVFLPQLEADLSSFSDNAESNIRFLAMLAGPFYPILRIVIERETARLTGSTLDIEASKVSQASQALTVSSNFEPRRPRNTSPYVVPNSSHVVFRSDVSRVLQKLIEPIAPHEPPVSSCEATSSNPDEQIRTVYVNNVLLADYSNLFGEEFRVTYDHWDTGYLNILDIGAVEEGVLHVLYACASEPLLCTRLAETANDFWSALPLVQALLPALRPSLGSPSDHIDESFSPWKQHLVQQALSQIVVTVSSPVYRPLLHACAGYLSSFSPSHAKASCVLIDLCTCVLAPWIAQVISKVDLVVELLEDLLGTILGARHSLSRARSALKYIVLALSGHMDDVLAKYKEAKHRVLFLLEMMEPFLDPAMIAFKGTISFGDVSSIYIEKLESSCPIAINVIRTAVKKPGVLPSLEAEWQHGSVAPSVLLSVLEPHMQLPPEIDICKPSVSKGLSPELSAHAGAFPKFNNQDDSDEKTEYYDIAPKLDNVEDASLLFAPLELKSAALTNICVNQDKNSSEDGHEDKISEEKHVDERNMSDHVQKGVIDAGSAFELLNLHSDCLQLLSYDDCEIRALEFRRLALDLDSQHEVTDGGHDAAIDALLLAAECYVNPFFVKPFKSNLKQLKNRRDASPHTCEISDLRKIFEKPSTDVEMLAQLEGKRDKIVLQILLEAAELDRKYQNKEQDGESCYGSGGNIPVIRVSSLDMKYADAVTLVRQNQALLCDFLIKRLQSEQHSMHEILLQSLLFLLHAATQLYCPPEYVVDIILKSAEYLNGMLTSFYYQFKDGNLQLSQERVHSVQRRWLLLQKLVIASSGNGDRPKFEIHISHGVPYVNLVPPSAWIQKIPVFSASPVPLVRFLGWMAVSHNAKRYLKERLVLTSDMSQITRLLSIFADELALLDNFVNQKDENGRVEVSRVKQDNQFNKGFQRRDQLDGNTLFAVIYPDLYKFFPNMKRQFEAFGEILMEAIGLQLRSLSSSAIPDVLCWFSDLCLWPFHQGQDDGRCVHRDPTHFKGYVAKNAKVIILYILEVIVIEHMEAMVPEIPRVVQVLVSLCRTSYCDVPFLDSVLCLLKPIISYSLSKVSEEEKLMTDNSCLNFEALCFNELLSKLKHNMKEGGMAEKLYSGALTIFILASVFPDLSSQCRMEILESLVSWADFTSFEPTTSFHDYLFAFQSVMDSCKILLFQTLKVFKIILVPKSEDSSEANIPLLPETRPQSHSWFLSDAFQGSYRLMDSDKLENNKNTTFLSSERGYQIYPGDIECFCKNVEVLILKLYPTIELCWKLHHQLSKKLTVVSAQCFMYSRCLSSVAEDVSNSAEDGNENSVQTNVVNQFPVHWKMGLAGLAEIVTMLQGNFCWEVASMVLDCIFGLPPFFPLDNVIGSICSTIKNVSSSAPKIAWRLQADKWLTALFERGILALQEIDVPVVDLFNALLCHPEPELRFIALQHLGRLVGQDPNAAGTLGSPFCDELPSKDLISVSGPVLSLLVSGTWNQVTLLAASDSSLALRTRGVVLIVYYIPFAERHQIQSLLASIDSIIQGLGTLAFQVCEGPLTQLLLALIATACLYSPVEDISLIPHSVWTNIESFGMSKNEGRQGLLERETCQALCRLRMEGDAAKEVLKEVLCTSSSKYSDPDFANTRESILQVVSNLSSIQSYFDFFSKKIEQDTLELEEAEIEMDLLQREHALQETKESKEGNAEIVHHSAHMKHESRLQQIREGIRSLEKSKLREEIAARRQKKLLFRRARQKYLEDAAFQEAELLQELDRERSIEAEREIERQRLLEMERAKTRELRHNLDIEKERQIQRELQKELEQAESGLRTSRRDFSSTHSSRPRDRFRERENGRGSNDGNMRGGSFMPETSTTTSMSMTPTVVLSGSRQFSGQLPTILQSRDRPDECGSSYDENLDGSKDSGDTGSVGDPDLASAFDSQPGGFGTGQRHGSRGSKSRQIMERREREGRREGKWERKH